MAITDFLNKFAILQLFEVLIFIYNIEDKALINE